MIIIFYVFMFILGACIGSFLCCQARRLHLKESAKHKKPLNHRSICLHCKKQLKWYDNLPIISWLILRGKCRYCHKKIGILEILSELGSALAFLLIGLTIDLSTASPLSWGIFIVAIIFTILLLFLAIYDGAYGELPNLCLILSILIAIIIAVLKVCNSLSIQPFTPSLIYDPLLSVAILGGIYLVLYLISKGKWVGDGDWLLGTAIAIALGTPWLALVALFLTNIIACLVMYPLIKAKPNPKSRSKSTSHTIHLGPFLVIAFVIIYAFADSVSALI